MSKRLRLALLLVLGVLALGIAACGGEDEEPAGEPAATAAEEEGEGEAVTVELAEQNDSGESGTATLTPDGEQTTVTIELTGAPSTPQPAHIHSGSCAELGDVVHPLDDVTDGMSETTVAAPLADLQEGEFAINVHESADAIQNYVACGDIE